MAIKGVRKEILNIRTAKNRIRPAEVLVERTGKAGRPAHMLPLYNNSKNYSELMRFFVMPLVNALDLGDDPNEKMSFQERIQFIFGAKHRDIVMAVAKVDFKMPGKVWFEDNPGDMVEPTTLQTRVLKGTPLMVRLDERSPDRIDIERCDDSIVFSLTRAEYASIVDNLQEITGCNRLLNPPTLR